MTYIHTWEGWLYLASIMDAYSRKIVGWAMDSSISAALVVDALQMGLARRRPEEGLIHHSDRGSQYTALIFTASCKEAVDRLLNPDARHYWESEAEYLTKVIDYCAQYITAGRSARYVDRCVNQSLRTAVDRGYLPNSVLVR